MRRLGVGLIGSGFMGRAHAIAFRAVGGIFALPVSPVLELLADRSEALAAAAANALGFARSTGDWQALVADSRVDIVAIAAPNALHKPAALAAIAQGKAVYCEKPLAANLGDAAEMLAAAESAGVTTLVGFNYLHNPMIALAREIVQSGEIGEAVSFRGIHAEDYMADPEKLFDWRCEPGGGVLADLGSHVLSLARYLVGDIGSVCGRLHTVHRRRPVRAGAGERREVTVDDQSDCLLRFANGASGSFSATWVACGRKMQLAFELVGTRGALSFTQERLNELQLYSAGQAGGRSGYKRICAGPEHPNYGAFCPAPGHQLGFNELKIIEVKTLLEALAGGGEPHPGFREAWEIQRVIEAVRRSSEAGHWVAVEDC